MPTTKYLYCAHCDYWAPSQDERFCPEGHMLKRPDGSRPLISLKYEIKTTGAFCAVCSAEQRFHEGQPRKHCHICGTRFG